MFNMRLIALCIFLLLSVNFLIYQNTQFHHEIENLKKENTLLKKEILDLEENLSFLNSSLLILKAENERLNFSEKRRGFILGGGENGGKVMILETEVRHGQGRILNSVEGNVIIDWSVQKAMKLALKAVERETITSLTEKDVIFRIISDEKETYIIGESAGAIFALTTIAALTGKKINESVVITGTILPTGRIGNVTGVREKIKAAKNIGAELVLVPKGQRIDIEGIKIIGVKDLKEAEEYIFC